MGGTHPDTNIPFDRLIFRNGQNLTFYIISSSIRTWLIGTTATFPTHPPFLSEAHELRRRVVDGPIHIGSTASHSRHGEKEDAVGSTTHGDFDMMIRILTAALAALALNSTLFASEPATNSPLPVVTASPPLLDLSNSEEDGTSLDLGYTYHWSGGGNRSHSSSHSRWHSYNHGGYHHYRPAWHSGYRGSYPGWHGYNVGTYNGWSGYSGSRYSYGYPGYVYPGYMTGSYTPATTYSPSYTYNHYNPVTSYNNINYSANASYWPGSYNAGYHYQYRWRQYDTGTAFRYWDTRGTNFTTWTDNDGVTFNLASKQGVTPTALSHSEADGISINLTAKQGEAKTTAPATTPTVVTTAPAIPVPDDEISIDFGKR